MEYGHIPHGNNAAHQYKANFSFSRQTKICWNVQITIEQILTSTIKNHHFLLSLRAGIPQKSKINVTLGKLY